MSTVLVTALILLAFLLALLFPLAYSFSHWRMYEPGRALMTFSVIVAAVLLLPVWRQLTGELAPDWIRVTVFASIILGLGRLNYALLKEQANDRRKLRQKEQGLDADSDSKV